MFGTLFLCPIQQLFMLTGAYATLNSLHGHTHPFANAEKYLLLLAVPIAQCKDK